MPRITLANALGAIKETASLKKGQYDFIAEIDRAKGRKFMWKLKGINGEILVNSEPINERKNVYLLVGRLLIGGLRAKVKDLTLG